MSSFTTHQYAKYIYRSPVKVCLNHDKVGIRNFWDGLNGSKYALYVWFLTQINLYHKQNVLIMVRLWIVYAFNLKSVCPETRFCFRKFPVIQTPNFNHGFRFYFKKWTFFPEKEKIKTREAELNGPMNQVLHTFWTLSYCAKFKKHMAKILHNLNKKFDTIKKWINL